MLPKLYVIRASVGLQDGNIHEQPVLLAGVEYTVSENCYKRWEQSAGNDIELLNVLIPNPKKSRKVENE